jgi:protein-S-isoprenylcysteine O-methyltransferase Ste14
VKPLETRVPPVVVFLVCGLLAWWPASSWPLGVALPAQVRWGVAALLAILAALVGVAALAAFREAKTSVNPLDPDAASTLVEQGIYRRSRNPMYLTLLLVLLAWAALLGQPAALLGPLLFVAWMNRFQIRPEEHALERKFGAAFHAYRRRVRRWL